MTDLQKFRELLRRVSPLPAAIIYVIAHLGRLVRKDKIIELLSTEIGPALAAPWLADEAAKSTAARFFAGAAYIGVSEMLFGIGATQRTNIPAYYEPLHENLQEQARITYANLRDYFPDSKNDALTQAIFAGAESAVRKGMQQATR
jgi:hypothetical protein